MALRRVRAQLKQLVELDDAYADQGLATFALAVDPFKTPETDKDVQPLIWRMWKGVIERHHHPTLIDDLPLLDRPELDEASVLSGSNVFPLIVKAMPSAYVMPCENTSWRAPLALSKGSIGINRVGSGNEGPLSRYCIVASTILSCTWPWAYGLAYARKNGSALEWQHIDLKGAILTCQPG